jgi:MerR family transcriptional regulator/heat shock protein HspR
MATVRLYRVQEVIETVGITRRALRVYEEYGLVGPASREEEDLYAEEALETLRRIRRLRMELGVNLAGVQVIMEMRRKMEDLQRSLDEVVDFVRGDLREELEHYIRREAKAIVPKPLTKPPKPLE